MSAVGAMSAGDLYGFAALFLIALTAALMLLRSKILKLTKNIALVRAVHLVLSAAAAIQTHVKFPKPPRWNQG